MIGLLEHLEEQYCHSTALKTLSLQNFFKASCRKEFLSSSLKQSNPYQIQIFFGWNFAMLVLVVYIVEKIYGYFWV